MNHRARFSLHCQFPGPLAFSHQDHMLTVAVALMVKSERQAKSETKTKGGAGVRASSRKLFLHLGAAHPFLSTLISKNQQSFLGDSQARIKISGRNANNLRCMYVQFSYLLLEVFWSVRSKTA